MPITFLNKVINVLLLGFLTLLALGVGWLLYSHQSVVLVAKDLGASGMASLILALTPAAVLAGTVVDRLAERTILSFIADATENSTHWLSRATFEWTRSIDGLKTYQALRDAVRRNLLVNDSSWSKDLPIDDDLWALRSTVEAIVLHSGSRDSIDWMQQHYVASRLASGLFFILLLTESVCVALLIRTEHRGFMLFAVVGLAVCLYALFTNAVDQYLYSYESIHREVLAILHSTSQRAASPITRAE